MHSTLLDQETMLFDLPQGSPELRGVLLYPHSYAVGMSSLATHTLYAGLNDKKMHWERVFIDPARDSTRFGHLCSLESHTLLRDFDVIALTSSYELDWPAIPAALESGGVAPLREDRQQGPLIIAGGPAISTAPLPLSSIYDVAYSGEIEPMLPLLKQALLAGSKLETLEQLAALPGFFVPELHADLQPGMIKRRCALDLNEFDTTSVVLSPKAEFANRFLVEMGRGCGRSCSFCLARRLYRPLRWRSTERILAAVQAGLKFTDDIGLVAAAVSDFPELDELCAGLEDLSPNLALSTSSVRMESATPTFLRLLARGGQRTVTFAPEAATERLRQAIGKTLPDSDIFGAVERAAQAGLSRVRLYFMIGLPTETASDRVAIADLAQRLITAFPTLHFRLNVGAFSPRPHTPFEMQPLPPLRDLRNWLSQVQRSLRGLPHLEVSTESARWGAMQAALSRADHRLGLALVKQPPTGFGELVASFASEGLDFDELIAAQDESQFLPWKIVDPACTD
jgi:radical SAM superfamily enzyme YgiQ (UPF0313 family)